MDVENGIECPWCHKAQMVELSVEKGDFLEYRCQNELCLRRMQQGNCNCCGKLVAKEWRHDRTIMTCKDCLSVMGTGSTVARDNPTHTSDSDHTIQEMDRLLNKSYDKLEQLGIVLNDLRNTLSAPANDQSGIDDLKTTLEELRDRIGHQVANTNKASEHLVNSMQGRIVQSSELLKRDIEENAESILESMKDFRASALQSLIDVHGKLKKPHPGQLTEDERLKLAHAVHDKGLPELTRAMSALNTKLLGSEMKEGPDGVKKRKLLHSSVPEMLGTFFDGLSAKLKDLDLKIAAMAGVITESSVAARSRGKNDSLGVVLSFNLAAIEEFINRVKNSSLVNLVQRLPDIFNRIEDDLKLQEKNASLPGKNIEFNQASVELLRDIQQSFANWQLQNNIVRFPKGPAEPFDFRLHELTRTLPTDRQERDRLIGEVDRHGYLFRGDDGEIILQKAEVAVWDFVK